MTITVSTLALTLIGCVLLTGLAIAGLVLYIGKKNGEEKETLFLKIRPIITEVIMEAVKIWEADKGGYDSLRQCAIDLAKKGIDELAKEGVLLPVERELFTDARIGQILDPFLKLIWDNQTQSVAATQIVLLSTD